MPGSGGTNEPVEIAALREKIAEFSKREDAIEAAILENPSKALAVPMLRQEFDTLRANNLKDIDSLNRQIDRVYDQNKWFIGLMFTMAIGIIGLAISNFIKAKEKKEEVK